MIKNLSIGMFQIKEGYPIHLLGCSRFNWKTMVIATSTMMLAQLVQPSSQTGPAKLPSARQIPTEQPNTVEIKVDTKDKSKDEPKESDNDSTQPGVDEANQTSFTIDKLPYNPAEIVQILGHATRLNQCEQTEVCQQLANS